jgi:hypothetical protein
MASCLHPKNQSVYNALIDKSATFPVRESYKRNAYISAAEAIRNCKRCIYDEDEIYGKIVSFNIPNAGLHVATFITMFINAKTFKRQYELVYNENIIDNSLQNVYTILGTSCEFLIEVPERPRCSQQLINKKLKEEAAQKQISSHIFI